VDAANETNRDKDRECKGRRHAAAGCKPRRHRIQAGFTASANRRWQFCYAASLSTTQVLRSR
jgi:hypothetical protein